MANSKMNSVAVVRKHLEAGDGDLTRQMVPIFSETLMDTEADALCNAEFGERSTDRVNQGDGYREHIGTRERGQSS